MPGNYANCAKPVRDCSCLKSIYASLALRLYLNSEQDSEFGNTVPRKTFRELRARKSGEIFPEIPIFGSPRQIGTHTTDPTVFGTATRIGRK